MLPIHKQIKLPQLMHPQNQMTSSMNLIMPGSITAFSGDIDIKNKTYELRTANKLVRMNFSPSIKNNTGWIVCDGSEPGKLVFPLLFETIGTLYGVGKSKDKFKLPDYCGYFLRGFSLNDKVDKGYDEREINNCKGSTGINTGVGSLQKNMVQKHKHKYKNFSGVVSVICKEKPASNSENSNVYTDEEIYSSNNDKESGSETRPVNMYVVYLIYAGLPQSNY